MIINNWLKYFFMLFFSIFLTFFINNVKSQCVNPNGQYGYCISLYACPSLISVVIKKPLLPSDKTFLRLAECHNGYGRLPLVCCNNDVGFYDRNLFNRNIKREQPSSTIAKFPKAVTGNSAQCINPNGQYGYCISLYECPPLISVAMKKPLSPSDINFLRQAECHDGFGRSPLVCCNNDVGFYETNFFGRNFPLREQPSSTLVKFPETVTSNSVKLPTPPQCGVDGISQKIYGGSDTNIDEFPWMALLVYVRAGGGQMTMNCGGSLINDRYVLTAAHCLKETILKKVGQLKFIRLGEYDTTKRVDCKNSKCADPILQVGIERAMPHEKFRDDDMHRHNDIGLVKLDRSVPYTDFIQPICLPFMIKATPPSPGSELIVVGWGRTLNARRSAIKQKLSVRVTSLEECSQKFRTKNVNVIESQLCAGGVLREDSCDGDSGGPLMGMYKNVWVLEGIVSFGIRCGFRDWPAVHTRVASYEDWIKSKIR